MISLKIHDIRDFETAVIDRSLEREHTAANATSRRAAEKLGARLALSRHLAAQGATIGVAAPEDFETTVLGAPYLSASSHHVGITHTENVIATVVYDKTLIVGIDIERATRQVDGPLDPRDFALCSTVSKGLLLPPIALFCAREAAGKALGIGLLAAWVVYCPSSVRDVSESQAPLWRIEFASLPFLSCYIAIIDSVLVLACAVAKRADDQIVRQALAELDGVRLVQ